MPVAKQFAARGHENYLVGEQQATNEMEAASQMSGTGGETPPVEKMGDGEDQEADLKRMERSSARTCLVSAPTEM